MTKLKAINLRPLYLVSVVFLIWRISLFLFLFLSQKTLPLQKDFLGGGRTRYLTTPYVWSWVNFDGEHYMAIAKEGYKPLTHFYFPAYPMIIRAIAKPLGGGDLAIVYTGLVLSNIFVLLSLIFLYDLVKREWGEQISVRTIVLLLLFPTSFYFSSFYTESLFLFLCVFSFWAALNNKWSVAGLSGALASATRIIGFVIFPALLAEWWISNKGKKKPNYSSLFFVFLAPLGLLGYMYYLWQETGNPLIFQQSIGIFGEHRSSSIVFIGRVFYRYLFKILPSLPQYWPAIFVTSLEFLAGTYFFFLSILGLFKLRLSYWIFLFLGFIIPTFSGSFSSMSRYVIVLFPGIILTSVLMDRVPKALRYLIYVILYGALAIASSLFFRGFWVA